MAHPRPFASLRTSGLAALLITSFIISPLSVFAEHNTTTESEPAPPPALSNPSPLEFSVDPEGGGGGTQSLLDSEAEDIPSFIRETAGIAGARSDSNSQSGAFAYDIPLVVPPGRSGMTPDLKLSYSNQSHSEDDLFGYGWKISIPYIERFNKEGMEDLYANPHFYSSLSGELVSTSSESEELMMMSMGSGSEEESLSAESAEPIREVAEAPVSTTEIGDSATGTDPIAPPAPLPPDAPQLKLKAPIESILGHRDDNAGVVTYAYKTSKKIEGAASSQVTKEAQKHKLTVGAEVVEKRTPNARTFATNRDGVFISEIIAGAPQYYKDKTGEWWHIDYGTTTKEAYDYQVEPKGIIKRILDFFSRIIVGTPAFADVTDTIYPSKNGGILNLSNTTWSSERSASAGTHTYTLDDRCVQTEIISSSNYRIARCVFAIPTGDVIPASHSISSATFSIYTTLKDDGDNDGNDFIALTQSSITTSGAVATGDFSKASDSLDSPSEGAARLDVSSDLTLNAYNTFTLNATGTSWIGKGSGQYTKLGIREGHDVLNDPITSSYIQVNLRYSDYTGTTYDPKLIVIHDVANDLTGGQYVARNDDGSNLTYTFENNTWTAKDKNGRTYLFGTSTAARQDDQSDPDRAYRWMLQQVTDANGNTITYSYSKDSGQIYPSSISYTGTATTTGIFTVDFTKSLRATSTATTTSAGFEVKTRYKIDQISAKVNGTWVRKYDLTYKNGDNRSRLLLSTITETGQDEQSTTIALPATSFSYSTSTAGWSTVGWTFPTSNFVANGNDLGGSLADVNGDGLADVVRAWKNASGTTTTAVYINNGSGWDLDTSWEVPCLFTSEGASGTVDEEGRLVDVNGDLLPDFLCITDVYLNTGSAWALSGTWTNPEDLGAAQKDAGARFADVNGDGLIDIVRSYMSDDGLGNVSYTKHVYINNGSGWDLDTERAIPVAFSENGGDSGARLEDVNADGLVDIIDGWDNIVYINTGSQWATSTTWTTPIDVGEGYVRLADLNGDGLVDIAAAEGTKLTSGSSFVWNHNAVYLNTGTSWVLDSSWQMPTPFIYNTQEAGVRFGDIDGDGVLDIVTQGSGTVGFGWSVNEIDLGRGERPDNIVRVAESAGGATTVTYKGSAEYRDGSDNLLNPQLPFVLTTAQKIEHFDGIGATTTETFEYRDGDYYYGAAFDRRLAGFGITEKTDDSGNTFKTFFHQGNATATSSGEYSDDQSKIGRAYRSEVYDSNDNLYSVSVNKWETYNRGGLANFVLLTRATALDYDGDADHKDKAEERSYSTTTNANLTQIVNWGEVTASTDGSYTDTGSDKRTTDITYAASSTSLLSLPSQETVTDQSAAKVRETKNYYDGLALNSITKGNLTKQEMWKSGSSYIDVEKTYNSFGLVTQTKDPRDKTTDYTYDTYNLYPATTTNALSQATGYQYDYSSGKAKFVFDANSRAFQTIYDALDRVTTEKQPDLTTPTTLVTKTAYTYTDAGMPRSVQKTTYLNSATSSDTVLYTDGFGRKVEERSRAEAVNTYAVRDYAYFRGLLKTESLPFFASSTTYTGTSSPAASTLLVTYTYDPMARPVTAANAVGTTTNAYDQWKVTTTDANGNVKELQKDAYNNLATVAEHIGASTATTTYEYNQQNMLTKITDAAGNIRNFTYDGLGRRLKAEDLHASADSSFASTTFSYDDAGNITTQIDGKNQTVNRTYDDLNRMLTEDYTGQAGTEVTNSFDWCPNGKGRLCGIVASGASTTNEYNALGLVSKETRTINGGNYATNYEYDRQGNKTKITYPDSAYVTYEYNRAGLPERIYEKEGSANPAAVISNFDYSPTGKVSFKKFGNGMASTYTYDSTKLYRLTNIYTATTTATGLTGVMSMTGHSPYLASAGQRLVETAPRDADLVSMIFAFPAMALAQEIDSTATSAPTEEESETTTEDLLPSAENDTATSSAVIPESSEASSTVATSTLSELLKNPISELLATATPSVSAKTATTTDTILATTTEATIATTTAETATTTPETPKSESIGDLYEQSEAIKAEYALKDGSLVAKAGDITVSVRAAASSSASVPEARLEKWGSAKLTVGLPLAGSAVASFDGNKIVWTDGAKKIRFYNAPRTAHTDAGYEIDVVLAEKPATNVVSFTLDSENLDFFYQPALNAEIGKEEADHCSETECFDVANFVIISRPENVVGSYAAYYKDGVSGDYSELGGTNYKTGKAFHIYRPKITDSEGKSVWGELKIAKGTLSVTVPQDFLDSATYPVTVDPTFGYSTAGASSGATTNAAGSKFTMPENGTITQVSEYTKAASGSINVGAAVYSDSSGAPNTLRTSHTSTPSQGTTASWVDVPVTSYTAATGTAYWLWGWGSASRTIYWDTGTTNQYNVQGMTWPTWDNPITPGTYFARKLSIYATYTASSSASTSTPQYVPIVQNISYTYDAVGNITQITDYAGTGAGKTISFGYDTLNRLTSASTTAATSTPFRHDYAYSSLGNITGWAVSGATTSYSYAGTGYANPHAATSIGGTSATYDNDGNLASYGSKTYTWDYRNRLTALGSGGATTTFDYDSTENRVKKVSGGVTTVYPNDLYNKYSATTTKQIFAGSELVATIEGNGSATSTKYVHIDHLGGVNAISDSSGNTIEVSDYYPYGSSRISTGPYTDQRGFIGEEYDTESSLSYLNARYYDGSRGQFLSEDPVFWGTQNLSDPQSLNSYSYANGNPIVNKDPNGQSAMLFASLVGGVFSGYANQYYADVQQNLTDGYSVVDAYTTRRSSVTAYLQAEAIGSAQAAVEYATGVYGAAANEITQGTLAARKTDGRVDLAEATDIAVRTTTAVGMHLLLSGFKVRGGPIKTEIGALNLGSTNMQNIVAKSLTTETAKAAASNLASIARQVVDVQRQVDQVKQQVRALFAR